MLKAKLLKSAALAVSLVALTAGAAVADDGSREGKTRLKVGVQGVFPHSKKATATFDTSGTTISGNYKQKNAVGGEVAASYFFTDNVAAEVAVGYTKYSAKDSPLKTRSIPLTATIQFHTQKIGGTLEPYVGVGYHYNFMKPTHKHFGPGVRVKVKNGSGPVLQAGANLALSQDVGLNLDVKQYWLKPKTTIRSDVINETITLKNKINPTVVTVGLTFGL